MKLGFVGVGQLGSKLAASLLRAGFAVTVHDLDERRAESLVADGAVWADTVAGAAAGSRRRDHLPPLPRRGRVSRRR